MTGPPWLKVWPVSYQIYLNHVHTTSAKVAIAGMLIPLD